MALLDPRNLQILLAALALEGAFGYPQALFRTLGHPVAWLGVLIEAVDRHLNRAELGAAARRTLGVAGLALLLLLAGAVAFAIEAGVLALPFGWLAEAVLAASLFSQRSLFAHVAAVAAALEAGGLAPARRAVAEIVGRNPESLDEAGVARAAIESLAENFSDGVVAPALWLALAGLPGLVLYKAINTADSMLGHLTPRHRSFGWAAARLDDLVNLPAARLAAGLLAAAACLGSRANAAAAWRTMWRDAWRHRSPNAGWPEAAMAGALGLRLAGPRVYGSERIEDAWMGDGRAEAGGRDVQAALGLYRIACALLWLVTAAVVLMRLSG
ncbi:MAG TPA: adenosylcobinamide-phosphate synthase CbiB [Alphaproteobacteria bacterium]|nr:adenosylcobinamide-phosphate synthase CbiB [Alphaproteobacteria bacterium]